MWIKIQPRTPVLIRILGAMVVMMMVAMVGFLLTVFSFRYDESFFQGHPRRIQVAVHENRERAKGTCSPIDRTSESSRTYASFKTIGSSRCCSMALIRSVTCSSSLWSMKSLVIAGTFSFVRINSSRPFFVTVVRSLIGRT